MTGQPETLPVLMYHHVSPKPGLVTVSPEVFRQHVQYLVQNGWTTVGATGVEDFFAGRPLPQRSVVITFDDGYLDNYAYAHPILSEFGLMAMLFIVTGWIGSGPARVGISQAPFDHRECKGRIAAGAGDDVMLRWSEVEEMQFAGSFEFHSHTHSHTRWDKALVGSDRVSALSEDIQASRRTLVTRLGGVSRHLCWPQGYYEPTYVDAAAAAGFDHLYTTGRRPNLRNSDPLHIGRVVAKERSAGWLGRRLAIYRSAVLSRFYTAMRGTEKVQ